MKVLETERLALRWLGDDDALFILRLVNEPSWLRYIGDKGVKTPEDARGYIEAGPLAMCRQRGFGLCRVELKGSGQPIGICGLIKRAALEDVDVGFAFLPEFWGKGYAFEAASAIMAWGRQTLGLSRFVAVASPDNLASDRLLGKLGFRYERMIQLQENGEPLKLYATADRQAVS